jgi:catechol 2,3-dioxygenase-like lactoylglutathione lyase family enzyme
MDSSDLTAPAGREPGAMAAPESWTPPLTAFCVLCHDVETHLSFYTEILGLTLHRREEGFANFHAREGIAICLWEIGHVGTHLGFGVHGPEALATRSIVCLSLPDHSAVETAHRACVQAGAAVLFPPRPTRHHGFGFLVKDRSEAVWALEARESLDTPSSSPRAPRETAPRCPPSRAAAPGGTSVRRLTLVTTDLDRARRFYAGTLGLEEMQASAGACAFRCAWGVELELLDQAAAPSGIRPAGTEAQRQAHLVMPAFGYDSVDKVDAAHTRLLARGVVLSGPPRIHPWNFYASYFTDPDRNIWEIFAPVRDDVDRALLG